MDIMLIRKILGRDLEHIIEVRKLLGLDCYTREAFLKNQIIDELYVLSLHATTTEEFRRAVRNEFASERYDDELRKIADDYMIHRLEMEKEG